MNKYAKLYFDKVAADVISPRMMKDIQGNVPDNIQIPRVLNSQASPKGWGLQGINDLGKNLNYKTTNPALSASSLKSPFAGLSSSIWSGAKQLGEMANPAAALLNNTNTGRSIKEFGRGVFDGVVQDVKSLGQQVSSFLPKSDFMKAAPSAAAAQPQVQDPSGFALRRAPASVRDRVFAKRQSQGLRVEQVPNGVMKMPSQRQMIDEGKMDLINYGPGAVSGPQ